MAFTENTSPLQIAIPTVDITPVGDTVSATEQPYGEESSVALPFALSVFSGWKTDPTEEDIRKLCESRSIFSDPGLDD